ncbi:hypothetical protein [Sphingomonas jatrophae]|uniref:Phytanoyl-CoA dioxygenase (PhyH) n=1 Tax=Sphingomonas jatrophae TaxID=1166337 RepID=A0A1I6KA79_9SPHN|nr:hypothetical protein [Sphingomonas jatrophae]SFR87948.1 hypothetical protein SAMN05192580_1483 [Sphingomonas jatrophae]
MKELKVSTDTSLFEVPAVLDAGGKLTGVCARQALAVMKSNGFVILTNLLSNEEADVGLELIRRTIEDPDRARCSFASETDNRYVRRDFCSLPSTRVVVSFAAMLCQRLEGIISAYCERSHPLLEITTLTSYLGSSHQYIHRDPAGVISLFAAVTDVSERQGGTVFIPGTHFDGTADRERGDKSRELMELFRVKTNFHIFCYNLAKLWRLLSQRKALLAPGEFRDRVLSRKWDEHQPNLMRFILGKNSQFSRRNLGPRTLWKLYRHRKVIRNLFHLVQTAPRKGTVILYQSDLLHAGPDNRSPHPRRLFSMSIARNSAEYKFWQAGYSPHPTLTAHPISFGDILDLPQARLPRVSSRQMIT